MQVAVKAAGVGGVEADVQRKAVAACQIAETGSAGGERAAQVGAETAVQQVGIRGSRPQVAELQGFGDDAVVLAQAAEIHRVI